MAVKEIMSPMEWENSPLSIARYYGGITINGVSFVLMPDRHLVRSDWVETYRTAGRSKVEIFLAKGLTPSQAKDLLARCSSEESKEEPSLF